MSKLPDELPPNAFLASMPWWVISRPATSATGPAGSGGSPGAAGYLVLDADGSTCLAVFTDEDLAERFARSVGYDGEALAAETPRAFAALASTLPPICTYVAFDPPARVGARARWVAPLDYVLKALELHDEAAGGR